MHSWLTWWALSLVISAVATPFAVALLPRFRAGGYAFARPLGVLLLGYLYWLGSTARVLPNSRLGVVLALLVLAAAAVAMGWRSRAAVRSALVGDRAFVLAVEALFLLAFAAAAFLRSYVPEIAATEKPMEFGFFNAVLRADHFPPNDPWLAGSPISYYYFGYVLLAAVTHLAGTAASVAFNLGLAFTFALAAAAIFGLGAELVSRAAPGRRLARPLIFGALAVGLALVLANLEGALELGAARGWLSPRLYGSLSIEGLSGLKATEHWYPDEFWWWWRATRIVPATITEFPFFSFLLGDLHPHVMAIPFRFLILAIGGAVLMGDWQPGFGLWRRHPLRLLIVALLIGTMGPLSTWDLPAMIALLFVAALLRGLRAGAAAPEALAKGVAFVTAPLLLGTVALLPFWLSIDSPGWGPRVVRGVATSPDHALLLWAPLGAIVVAFTLGALRWGEQDCSARRAAPDYRFGDRSGTDDRLGRLDRRSRGRWRAGDGRSGARGGLDYRRRAHGAGRGDGAGAGPARSPRGRGRGRPGLARVAGGVAGMAAHPGRRVLLPRRYLAQPPEQRVQALFPSVAVPCRGR